MEMIPIAGVVIAVIGLLMMVVAGVMFARGNKRQVKVVIPTSTAGRMPPAPATASPKPAPPQPPPVQPPPKPAASKSEAPVPPPPPVPKPEPPKAAEPKTPPPPPPPAPDVDPRVSEEGTRIAMLPPPPFLGPPPPDEATVAQPLPTFPVPDNPPEEEPQSTIAISPGDMMDFRTIVEQEAPPEYGFLVGLTGGMEGREVRIDEEGFVIGRDQRTAQLVISDPRISKRHVWVGVRDGEVWAVDVGSTNGTYLNVPRSERIAEVTLNPGDVLILSEDAARFEYRKK